MAEKSKSFVLSDESLNSYGFRVMTSGISLDQFRKNPVMLLNHDDTKVIGTWEKIRVEGNQLLADPVFDEDDAEAMKIKGKVDKGIIKGASMGFEPTGISDAPEMKIAGQTRPTVTGCEISEASICAIPSNSNALALYDKLGNRINLKKGDDLDKLLPLSTHQNNSPDMKLNATTLTHLKLTGHADPSGELVDKAVEQLAARATTAEAALAKIELERKVELKSRAETLIDEKGIKLKKLTASDRDKWVERAMNDYGFVEETLSKISGADLPGGKTKEELSAEKNTERKDWTWTDWKTKDLAGLMQLKVSDNATYRKLAADAKVKV